MSQTSPKAQASPNVQASPTKTDAKADPAKEEA